MWTTINLLKDKLDGTTDKIGISFYLILIIFNIVYIASLVGIVLINSAYISIFNVIVHGALCLFLMYRFNPLSKNIEIKNYDRVIIFSIALFLLLNLGIVETIKTIQKHSATFMKDGKTRYK